MKKKILNVWYFLQGWTRYYIYYSKHKDILMFPHIEEQITCRIMSMDSQCFSNGTCKKCGCKTTALQMANKACEGHCYPKMLSKSQWTNLMLGYSFKDEKLNIYWKLSYEKGMLVFSKKPFQHGKF